MERARANEFGGTITDGAWTETKERSSKALGSMMALFTLVKILNSSETRKIVAVGRQAVGDDAFAHLFLAERLDHVVILGLFPNPAVTLIDMPLLSRIWGNPVKNCLACRLLKSHLTRRLARMTTVRDLKRGQHIFGLRGDEGAEKQKSQADGEIPSSPNDAKPVASLT